MKSLRSVFGLFRRPEQEAEPLPAGDVEPETAINLERLGIPSQWDESMALQGLITPQDHAPAPAPAPEPWRHVDDPFVVQEAAPEPAPAPTVERAVEPIAEPIPAAPPSPLDQARALAETGRVQSALEAYNRLLASDPHCVEAWYQAGILRQEEGDIPGALAAWEAAVAADPTHWIAHLRRALVLAGLQRRTLAVASLEQARLHAPSHSEVAAQLAAVYAALGWHDAAVQAIADLPDPLPGWWERTRRDAAAALAESEKRAAALLAQKKLGRSMGPPRRLAYARLLLALGHLQSCKAEIQELIGDMRWNLNVHAAQAALLLRSQGAEAALAYLTGLADRIRTAEGFAPILLPFQLEAGDSAGLRDSLPAHLQAPASASSLQLCAASAIAAGDDAMLDRVNQAWTGEAAADQFAPRFAIFAAFRRGAFARLHGPRASAAPNSEIPAQIVQFWHGDQPADVAETMATWRHANPTLGYRAFGQVSAREFIAAHTGADVLAAYDGAHHPAMQSDLFRLAYLKVRGGIYIDADERATNPLDTLLASFAGITLAARLAKDVPPYVDNAFIAAAPNNPIIAEALADAVRALAAHREAGDTPDIWQTTGPGPLTRAIGRAASRKTAERSTMLLTDTEYRSFGVTADLAYKSSPAGNWRIAGE